jgi:hypothetical protein
MWRHVDHVWNDVSEERIASSTLKMEATRSSETSVHTRSTRRHIPEDGILHSHRCENLKSYLPIYFLLAIILYLSCIASDELMELETILKEAVFDWEIIPTFVWRGRGKSRKLSGPE